MEEPRNDVGDEEPGWVGGLPNSRIGQSCAFCTSGDVAWAHPLDADLVRYEQHGKGQALPTFWTLCDPCETVYRSGDDDAAVDLMRGSDGWSWVTDEDVDECIRKPLAVFRRADEGGRPLTG